MKLTNENSDYPDCGNPDRETGVQMPDREHLRVTPEVLEAQRVRRAAAASAKQPSRPTD